MTPVLERQCFPSLPVSGCLASLWRGLPHVTQPCLQRGQEERAPFFRAGAIVPQAIRLSLGILRVDEIVTTHGASAILAPHLERTPATFTADPTQFRQIRPPHSHDFPLPKYLRCFISIAELDLAVSPPYATFVWPSRSSNSRMRWDIFCNMR